MAFGLIGHKKCQLAAWKPGMLSQASSARSPQPRVLSGSARNLQQGFLSQKRKSQPGVLSQQSPANLFGVRAGVIRICTKCSIDFRNSSPIASEHPGPSPTWLQFTLLSKLRHDCQSGCIGSIGPKRLNRAHWPTKEIMIFHIVPAHGKIGPN